MEGTVRTFDEEVRQGLAKRIPELVKGIATAMRAEADVTSAKAGIADAKAAQRYDYSNKAYCPGDQRINSLSNVTTTFIVRAPDTTPTDMTDNPAICAISFSPYTSGYFSKLDQTQPGWNSNQGLENLPFWKIFRRWVDICTISSACGWYMNVPLLVRTNS